MSRKHKSQPRKTTEKQPVEPPPSSVWERVWTSLRSDEWLVPLAIFIGSRLALFLIATLFLGLVPKQMDTPPGLIKNFMQWDSGWYTGLVEQGYTWSGPDKQSNVAFFPLYPLMSKVVSFVLLGNTQAALFLISNIAFFFYLYYLYKLAKRDFDPGTAERSILYVAIFALSFFFSAGYTESLMLALATASFYYAREGKWLPALVLGLLTTLTRLTGIAILAPLCWEWYKQKGLTLEALKLLVVPAGLGAFMLYLGQLTGDPLAFNTVQKAWNHQMTWPWGTFSIGWNLVTTLPRTRYITAIAMFDFGSMVAFLLLTLAAIYFMPPAYWLYSLPVYFLSTSATLDPTTGLPTASIARYLMSIFPVFVLLGKFGKNKYVHYILLFLWAALLGPLMLYFFAGIWVE